MADLPESVIQTIAQRVTSFSHRYALLHGWRFSTFDEEHAYIPA